LGNGESHTHVKKRPLKGKDQELVHAKFKHLQGNMDNREGKGLKGFSCYTKSVKGSKKRAKMGKMLATRKNDGK